jgi:adenine/guanine phosphoribosyltransferase-like PRPP-binding protein
MPALKTLIFGVLAIFIGWLVCRDFARGVSNDNMHRYTADENPIGYTLAITSKGLMFAFAVAEALNGFGLIADPLVAIHAALPFLPTRRY